MPTPLNLFAIFHLNLAYSAIELEQHAEVLERCYWPLLRLAEETGLPFGIEASVYTLEAAGQTDPGWLAELRRLVTEGACEFVGAGYAQLIGPLVPASVNEANQRLGIEGYERLLGIKPRIVLVNEQAYSAGLLQGYLDAAYEALFMEWDNAARVNPRWNPAWRYLPQVACGQHGERLPVLWNKSAAFQRFQHYAHGEIEIDEYMSYIERHVAETPRALCLYGNDIEIFDFRPGRYDAEPVVGHSEWERIALLFERIVQNSGLELVSPSQVLVLLEEPGAGNEINLETPELPVPVKKQGKYNLTRWAVTGRDDLGINTRCERLAARLDQMPATEDDWRELCYLWSSDFRTHVTARRWDGYRERLSRFEERIGLASGPVASESVEPGASASVERGERFLELKTDALDVRLNVRRGLVIEGVGLSGGAGPLFGTLPHGYFDDINMTADFYTGHAVLERLGAHKVTDLDWADIRVDRAESGPVSVSGEITTSLGAVRKTIRVDDTRARLSCSYEFDWPQVPPGSLRVGHVTLLPEAFDRATLYYATHNGGRELERFPLCGHTVDHGLPVSLMVTASTCLGMTGGVFEFGDADRTVRIEVDRSSAALVGMVTYREIGDSFFCRLALSVFENDETSRRAEDARLPRVGFSVEIL